MCVWLAMCGANQGAQFASQLMTELCQLCHVEKTHITPYHPQVNSIVDRNTLKPIV